MLAAIYELSKTLDNDLIQIETEDPDILTRAEKSIQCIRICLKKMKDLVKKSKFSNQDEEIHFFKKVKPSIYSKLIFFVKVFNIEIKRPTGSTRSQKKYLLKELERLENFFSENLEFYKYMRYNQNFLDVNFFVRDRIDIRLNTDTFYFDTDPSFSTSHDFKASKILANDLLSIYLNSEIAALARQKRHHERNSGCNKSKYSWTASKNALVELIYALHAVNAINNGSVDIKEIAKSFEFIFNVDLTDVYHTFLEIKNRNHPSKFLDTLKNAFIEKINEELA